MNINTLLEEEIVNEFNELHGMEKGSDKYKTTVDGLTKLMDRAIEMEKFEVERKDRLENQKDEMNLKIQAQETDVKLRQAQMNDEKIDRYVRNGITLGLGLLSAGCAIWGTVKTLEFEKEGSITTIFGRGWINKLLPKK